MCFAVCLPLYHYLILCGYDVSLIEGEIETFDDVCNHFWIKLKDGQIIDPTADQFKKPSGDNMPKIYFGDKPSWYKVIS